jgi:hypothetical protein
MKLRLQHDSRNEVQAFMSIFKTPKRREQNLFFLAFLIIFYIIEILWIKPVDGINDDWGMYSTLSGAYLGYPEAHVMFFLYPLSWLLCQLYKLCSFIPWYGLFQHGVQIVCLYTVYHRFLCLWRKRNLTDAFWKPALAVLFILFFIIDINVISEAQYTTTAGLAAACALFCFITTRSDGSLTTFLKANIPTFLFAWIAFSMRQNVLYLMLPMAGMLWLSKWIIACRLGYEKPAAKLLLFALILLAGMGCLLAINSAAYSDTKWADFRKINHYRERIGDFYSWPEYEECADALTSLGISEEDYMYRKNGAPYIGYGMSVDDWKQMHDIARECYLARTDTRSKLKNIATGTVKAFFYSDGMQPANILAGLLLIATLILILATHNSPALLVYLFYLFGRMVSWGYVLYEGRFPKRIIQPLITADYLILFGILLGFNLLKQERRKPYAAIIPCITVLSILSLCITKNDIDVNYHANQQTWEDLKEYCHSHPDNFYIWTYNSGTLENYCESPFDLTLDTYNNFFYTNWGVVCNPNSRTKLAQHGIEDFGADLIASDNVCFILQESPYPEEHPVIMYLRHTYGATLETVDTFTAGENTYYVYRLQK